MRKDRHLLMATGAGMLFWYLALPEDVFALSGDACAKAAIAPEFVPVLPGGISQGYYSAFYSIGLNNSGAPSNRCKTGSVEQEPAPVATTAMKSALLRVPPVVRTQPPRLPVEVAATAPEPPQADILPPEVVEKAAAPEEPVVGFPAPAPAPAPDPEPAPVPEPVPVEAKTAETVTVEDDEGYSEPSLLAPVVLGVGMAAVLTYGIVEMMDEADDKAKPQQLSLGSEPVRALVAYDSKMLASFAAQNTVADLQSGQRISMGISTSVYDETAALAAGVSLRLGMQGVLKTAVSFSGDTYLASAGLSYGW